MAAKKKSSSPEESKPRPEPTLVLFVRHGVTPTTGSELPGRSPGLHLSEAGQAQAALAAERIATLGRRVKAIYTSPLERTRETAAPIAEALSLEVRTSEGLLELDVGSWTGRKLSELYKLAEWRTVQKYPSGFSFPGGESFGAMQTRITETVSQLTNDHRNQVIVCVSHADPIRALLAHAMGTHLDLFQRIVVSPASISAVSFSPEGPVVLAVNSIGGPLEELAP